MTDQPVARRSAHETAEDLASGLAQQRVRVDALAGSPTAEVDLAAVLGEIDIAHEELRVAEEELRAQQHRLDQLLADRSDPRSWRRGLISTLPVAALVTDVDGTVLELNVAAWSLLGRRRDEIVDRPLTELVDAAGHPALQQVLRDVVAAPGIRQVTLPLVDGEGPTARAVHTVDLVVGADDPLGLGNALVTWVAGDSRQLSEDQATGLRTAEAFAEMCRLPLSGADTRTVLAHAALLVEKALPASDGVSITLGPPAEPETQATDNAFAQWVDGAQVQAAEGPCNSAYETGRTVVCEDLGADERWPRLAPLAQPLGVRAVLACPLRMDRHCLGVLNVYARRTDAFGPRDRAVADLLVSAVLAVVQETRDRRELTQLGEQLREALRSRAVIDQAKGILMSRNRVGPDQAFADLVAASRRSNTKVRDVARLVVDDAAADADRAAGTVAARLDGTSHGPTDGSAHGTSNGRANGSSNGSVPQPTDG